MLGKPGDAVACGTIGQPVEVIEDQSDIAQFSQLVHQAHQHDINQGSPGYQLGRDRRVELPTHTTERLKRV